MSGYSTPPEAPGFSGAIFSDTTGTTKISDLGLSCLYVGGGGNTASAPNANPDGPNTIFGVSTCPGNTLNLAASIGTGTVAGNSNGWGTGTSPIVVDCSLGPYATKHCTRTNAACTIDDDCALGSVGLCNPDPRCMFGTPLPVPAGPTSTCILNVVRSDASGSVDKVAGSSNITIPLASYVFLTQNTEKFCRDGSPGLGPAFVGRCNADTDCTASANIGRCANEVSLLGAGINTACPVCDNFGTGVNHCISGQNHGSACTPVGLKKTTLDCLPKKGDFIAPLNVDLSPLGTGSTSITAVANPSRSGQFFFCPLGGGAATCATSANTGETCQRTQGAFGRLTAKFIRETGQASSSLTDFAAHNVTISATFCIPGTGNGLIDGGTGADLPGPGAVSIRGTFQLTP